MDTVTLKAGHVHDRITAEIVSAMERGQKDYEMPWHNDAASMPTNAVSRKR